MKKRTIEYPGAVEAEREKNRALRRPERADDEPDWIDGAPNYDKFERMGWDASKTLAWLNID